MKLFVSIFLSFLFASNVVVAAEKTPQGMPNQLEQQVDKKNSNAQSVSLGVFQNYVVVGVEGREIAVDDNNQAYVLVKFTVENIPEHHYFCASKAGWILLVAMEGYVEFGVLD